MLHNADLVSQGKLSSQMSIDIQNRQLFGGIFWTRTADSKLLPCLLNVISGKKTDKTALYTSPIRS